MDLLRKITQTDLNCYLTAGGYAIGPNNAAAM